VSVSEPTASAGVERKRRHVLAAEESYSDSESASLQSHNELGTTTQLLPRPRSSISLIELIDSSTHAVSNIEQLITDTTTVCTEHMPVDNDL